MCVPGVLVFTPIPRLEVVLLNVTGWAVGRRNLVFEYLIDFRFKLKDGVLILNYFVLCLDRRLR